MMYLNFCEMMEYKIVLVITECLLLVAAYSLSLYVWNTQYDRNHPSTIKKRFVRVLVINLLSPFYVWFFIDKTYLEHHSLWNLLGIRLEGLIQAICLPLFLTVVLFMGPLVLYYRAVCRLRMDQIAQITLYRDLIVAPISEEVTFRACLVPLLSQCFHRSIVVLICPVFFGAAHFNHFIENVRRGVNWKSALFGSCIQMTFTTIFGAYSTFLFLRTGHIVPSILAHVFCNFIGMPDLTDIISYEGWKKYFGVFCYLAGVVLWAVLLFPITEPKLYNNNIYWTNESDFLKTDCSY